MKKLIERIKSKRDEGYIDVAVGIIVVMVLLVAVMKITPIFSTKMTLNSYANELCR